MGGGVRAEYSSSNSRKRTTCHRSVGEALNINYTTAPSGGPSSRRGQRKDNVRARECTIEGGSYLCVSNWRACRQSESDATLRRMATKEAYVGATRIEAL